MSALSADLWHGLEGELLVETFKPIDSACLLTTHLFFQENFGVFFKGVDIQSLQSLKDVLSQK